MKCNFLGFLWLFIILNIVSKNIRAQEWSIKPKFEYAAPFSNGLALVKEAGRYGFINDKGIYVIIPKFDIARSFKDNYAAVGIVSFGKTLWNFVDKQGNMLMSRNFSEIYDFNEGVAAFKDTNGKWGFISNEGYVIISPRYDGGGYFIDGVALIKYGSVHSFIDSKGNLICSEKYKTEKFKDLKLKYNMTTSENKYVFGKLLPSQEGQNWGYKKITLDSFLKCNLDSWNTYLFKNLPSIESYEHYLKPKIEAGINIWQRKGEFEPTSEWSARVNEETRKAKIEELTNIYKKEYEIKLAKYKEDYGKLVEQYSAELKRLQEGYYTELLRSKESDFAKSSFTLMSYDADNQSFLIKSDVQGDMLISVPLSDAPSFKQNWNVIKNTIKPKFVPSGDDMVLTSVSVNNGAKEYIYDSHTKAKYAITEVNYNFTPVEISLPDVADVKYTFDPVEVIQSTVVQTSPMVKGLEANNATIERKSIDATNQSDVDVNIPQSIKLKNSNTFVVIIANEDYQRVSDVTFAANDGKLFAEYCTKALGLPQNHVMLYTDATLGNMLGAVNRMKEIGEAYSGKANIIFYYAGHGIPDETSKDAYLLPVDGDGASVRTCYKQSELFAELASIKANSVVVFMDACFSGAQRGDGMLMAARGIAIKAKKSNPLGNMVVFSAAQGDETAYPYKEQRHGMFTYYLLKKLQETKGEATLGEISDYVTSEVRKQSIVINGKMQTPTLTSSSAIGDSWRNWKLK